MNVPPLTAWDLLDALEEAEDDFSAGTRTPVKVRDRNNNELPIAGLEVMRDKDGRVVEFTIRVEAKE